MWIAFKNYYLRDTTQLSPFEAGVPVSCELLSKIIIFVTRHNRDNLKHAHRTVVNCFQKLLSSWHDTTTRLCTFILCALWIAFKNYYLRDTTQRKKFYRRFSNSCELLSKIIIFVTRHTGWYGNAKSFIVVNCFQKLLSSWHDTTAGAPGSLMAQLWIAFKNYYLRDTTQLADFLSTPSHSCELLSKIIIFVTRHNWK